MGISKLWGKDKDGNRGFLFSHVKTIYYNWASKILLSTKLDEMDALIDAKIAKAMMSNQQVNSTDKVPTSALAYAMSQNIAKNTSDITALNGSFKIEGLSRFTAFRIGNGYPFVMRGELLNSEDYYQFVMTESEGYFGKQINNKWVNLWNVATKSDLAWKKLGVYNITTTDEQRISTPAGINEILLFAGYPNTSSGAEHQVYGGKSYIIPALECGSNIVYEHDFYDASGNGPRCGGFYAFWSSSSVLALRALRAPVRVRIYYR